MVTKKKTTLTHKLRGVPVKTQLAIVTGAVCLLALFGAFVGWLDTQVDISNFLNISKDNSVSFGDVTIHGESTCLTHKGKGPHTMECAMGIKTPSGDYAVIGMPTKLDKGQFEAKGTLTPPAKNSAYETQGTITIK